MSNEAEAFRGADLRVTQRDSSTSLGTTEFTRREAMRMIAGSTCGLLLPVATAFTAPRGESAAMITRSIPSTGEKIPVIGLGTSQTFDVGDSESERAPLAQVVSNFVKLGGKLIDSSPMYGRAEEVIGDLLVQTQLRDSVFLATKVWTQGKQAGIESMERSLARFKTTRIDLMQVHNLVDLDTQLATLRDWKAARKIRYLGITHHNESSFPEVERILRREKLDFLQINYSIMERAAEETILPLARDRGVAVIVNRPFARGGLFASVRSKPLPDFSREFDCNSWAQFFLKWIIANPAVTCVIPATDNAQHLEDNMRGGIGRFPDAKLRQRMVDPVKG
jgi:aryl-alcohol dehydrogenase-like predicted oxidoreductase